MADNSKLEAWTVVLDDQQISDTEQVALTEALEDSSVGRELAADQRLHNMLSAMHHIDETREDFISLVELACSEPASTGSVIADSEKSASVLSLKTTSASPTGETRRTQQSVWMHPVVVVLGATTITAVTVMFAMAARLNSLENSISQLQAGLERQQAELERQNQIEQQAHPLVPIVQPLEVSTVDASAEDRIPQPVEPIEIDNPVATLTRMENARWEIAPVGRTLGPGPLCLKGGEAELLMADGSLVQLTGPADVQLLDAGHLTLERGHMAAQIPEDAVGLRVSTPSARILDADRQFFVDVGDAGETDVRVVDGELTIIPAVEDAADNRWHLEPNMFTQASIKPPEGPNGQLLSSTVAGPAGFQGQIQLGGNGILVDDPDRFRQLRDGVLQRFRSNPEQAVRDWLQLAEAANSFTVTVNGEDMLPKFFGSMQNIPDSATTTDMFVGKIVINGEERTFHSAEEFEAFRHQMTQPFPDVLKGIGSATQFEKDLKTDPFLPQK